MQYSVAGNYQRITQNLDRLTTLSKRAGFLQSKTRSVNNKFILNPNISPFPHFIFSNCVYLLFITNSGEACSSSQKS